MWPCTGSHTDLRSSVSSDAELDSPRSTSLSQPEGVSSERRLLDVYKKTSAELGDFVGESMVPKYDAHYVCVDKNAVGNGNWYPPSSLAHMQQCEATNSVWTEVYGVGRVSCLSVSLHVSIDVVSMCLYLQNSGCCYCACVCRISASFCAHYL